MQENGKKVIVGGLKGGIFCFVVGTVFVLLTALAAKWFNLSDTALNITAQVLRVAAVVVGVLFFVREGAYLPKALVAATVYWLLCLVCTLVCGGSFNFGHVALDLAIAIACAVVVALLKSRR